MDEAGGDVAERETRLLEERLDVPQRLLGLGLDASGQLLGLWVGPALAGKEDPVAEVEARRVRGACGPMRDFVIPLLP